MTIISPKRKKGKFNWIIIGLISLLLAGAVVNVFLYNQVVSDRHNLDLAEARRQQLKTTNAEIKSRLYQLTSIDNLVKLGKERGLRELNSPYYIRIGDIWSTAFVSQ